MSFSLNVHEYMSNTSYESSMMTFDTFTSRSRPSSYMTTATG